MPRSALRPILAATLIATLIAGTLDILSAFVFTWMANFTPPGAAQPLGPFDSIPFVLRYVASGPFGDAALTGGAGWAAAGLAIHFAIMACMAAAYMIVARRVSALLHYPIVAGLLYGLVLWGIMYWLVKPLRWPDAPLPHGAIAIAKQLFSHCILVGLPIALVARRHFRHRLGPFA